MGSNGTIESDNLRNPAFSPDFTSTRRFSLPGIFHIAIYLLLIAQVVLVVTGGAVRLTGSGLGCPTWPDCFHGTISPLPHPAQGYHAWIEFGNRLLTGVDLLILIFVFLAVFTPSIKRVFLLNSDGGGAALYKRTRNGAIIQILGFFAQAVLGGITVLTHLNPIPVSGHFLLSIYLIFAAHRLLRSVKPQSQVVTSIIVVNLARALQIVTALVIVIGTVVTGSGPHAGDISAKRYGFDPRIVSWFHADMVIALISLSIGLYLISRLTLLGKAQTLLNLKVMTFIIVALSQGLIGYVQYFTALPELLVGAHMLGACLVWITVCELGTTVCTDGIAMKDFR